MRRYRASDGHSELHHRLTDYFHLPKPNMPGKPKPKLTPFFFP